MHVGFPVSTNWLLGDYILFVQNVFNIYFYFNFFTRFFPVFSALFMIRDEKFTRKLPDDIKEAFVENKTGKVDKLKDILKQKFPVSIKHHT